MSTKTPVATFLLVVFILSSFTNDLVAQTRLQLQRISNGFSRPVFAAEAPGEPGRLYVVEQHTGRIRILDVDSGVIDPTPFITISGIRTGNEQGVLGLAFHPDYENNGFFFVNYTDTTRATRIRRYTVVDGAVDTNLTSNILTIPQPQNNHNAGWIGFGPDDGYLYIATGDGGSANDIGSGHTPEIGNSRDIEGNLLGKILRLDVDNDEFPTDSSRNYAIPANNPFVNQFGADEIYAFALRNPYRCSFDTATGNLYIADVGQGRIEEINVLAAGDNSGADFGWRLREGTIATPQPQNIEEPIGGPKPLGAVDPVHQYGHGSGRNEGFSVTGGYVYRGSIEALKGQYFFADFVSNRLWSFEWDGTVDPFELNGTNINNFFEWTDQLTTNIGSVNSISSFAENAAGEIFVIGLDGEIFRVVAATIEASSNGDFLRDGTVDLTDIDLLRKNIGKDASGANATFDLNEDGSITFADLEQHLNRFVETSVGVGTFLGDLNLDGRVDVLNDAFTLVGNLGQTVDSYADGDINGDGQVTVLGDAFILVSNLGN